MNFPHATWMASAATADGPKLADWLTAIGTVGLVLVTVITLIVTARARGLARSTGIGP